MISACAESQGWEEAVTIFDEMMANEVAPDIKSTLASKKGTGSSTFCAPGPMVTLSQSLMGFHRKTYRTCPPWLDGKKPWDIAGRCPMIFPEKPFHSKPKYRWFSSL